MEPGYTKRELDIKLDYIVEKLDKIETQTTKHNGRLSRQERILLIVGTAVSVLMVVNGSETLTFLTALI